MKTLLKCSVAVIAAAACSLPLAADEKSPAYQAIAKLQSVKPNSEGTADARAASTLLAKGGAANLLPVLKGFAKADPLAANWLRSTFEKIADAERAAGRKLPEEALISFVKDRSQSPVARRLAYEWVLQQNPAIADQVIPEMLLDPSPEFRRDAVARLIEEATKAENPEKATPLYRKAMEGAVHEDQVNTIAKALRDAGGTVNIQQHFGFLPSWQIIGPFDNKEEKGFGITYPPESEVRLDAEYEGQLGPVKWAPVATEDDYGVVDIAKQIQNYKGSLMYATTTFDSDREQQVEIRLGTPNAWKMWVNGQQVFEREEYHRSSQMDQYRVPVTLKAGSNTILIKVCQNEQTQDWAQRYQFQVRISDATGSAIAGGKL
ncbi:MAG: hypothetical protein JNL58_22155 [Planctomyces sp.]|nr:hypothetical protein [Planctomyces sp.]